MLHDGLFTWTTSSNENRDKEHNDERHGGGENRIDGETTDDDRSNCCS